MSEKSPKEARKVTQVRWFHSAEVQGIEPQFAAPKTAVLPLDDTSKFSKRQQQTMSPRYISLEPGARIELATS
jgi:hypothetical protein